MQDFLRIVSRRHSAESVFATVFDRADPVLGKLRREVERRLQSAEDQAQRAYVWGATPAHNHEVLTRLHNRHQRLVNWLFGRAGQTIRDRLQPVLRDPLPAVKLCYPCSHFDQCYALNRFLVLLLARYCEELPRHVLRPATVTTGVAGDGHTCANQPRFCHGKPHNVVLEPTAADCQLTSTGPGVMKTFDVVVIRHGIVPPPLTTQLTTGQTVTGPMPRQLLPYHVPR